jgi:hypothetical protein
MQALIDQAGADPSIHFNDLRSLSADLGPQNRRPGLAIAERDREHDREASSSTH